MDTAKAHRPLTIVQVASALPNWGGLELHLLNLGAQLQARGHTVWVAAQPGSYVDNKARTLGLPTFAATLVNQHDYTDFRRYHEFFRRERVDVVHAHTNNDALVPALAARLAGVPVSVVTWHLPSTFRTPKRGRLLMRLHNRLVTVSESVRQMHLRHGIPPNKVQTIYHGTDIEAFARTTQTAGEARAALGIPEGRISVGIVGRIVAEKGHAVLLQAAHLLKHLPLHYVVVGDGADEDALRAQAHSLGIAGRVTFAGFRDDVNNAMGALDIVAVPSTWEEPCSAIVQQAMALRKPVVGTRVGGTPEMVQENVTGLLVPPSDADALAEAVACLAGDASLRRRLGEAGRARAEAHFSLRGMTDTVEALYRREHKGRRKHSAAKP